MTRLKSSKPKNLNTGNTNKYLSYKEAWTRIKLAQEEGFYLEAVTIVESIISDRLISYLVGIGKIKSTPNDRTSFEKLIKNWQSCLENQPEVAILIERINKWKIARNQLIHGMVKSEPTTPTMHPEDFLILAQKSAKEGETLAKAVTNWHKQEFKKHLQSKK